MLFRSLRADNSDSMNIIIDGLKKIKNVKTVLIHLAKGINNPTGPVGAIKQGVWGSLQQFSFYTLKIMDAIKVIVDGDSLPIVTKVSCFDQLQPISCGIKSLTFGRFSRLSSRLSFD